MVGLVGWLLLGGRSSLGGLLLFSSLAFASHFSPSLSSSPSSSTSTLHLSSETPTGAIVKRFPRLPALSLLPSKDSDTFYLLPSGELMLARPLTCSEGSNLSLAVMHEVEEGGPASIHLLEVLLIHPFLTLYLGAVDYEMILFSCTCTARGTTWSLSRPST